jgi:uncharacterized protein YggU (UPF0235/DUF167 family)
MATVATAFGLRRRNVTLIADATSRIKILEVDGATQEALDQLLGLGRLAEGDG